MRLMSYVSRYTKPYWGESEEVKLHYFNQDKADEDDWHLNMAKEQGYVPQTCLISGHIVMGLINVGENPCWGCNGPREKCKGKPKK